MRLSEVVLDTSAVVAILAQEAEAPSLLHRASRATSLLISAGTVFESAMVATRFTDDDPFEAIVGILHSLGATIVPIDSDSAKGAVDAFLKFGKGRHKAALNFGDCFVYSLARHHQAPILCVGEDFSKTDADIA